jgi:hypothetical protein
MKKITASEARKHWFRILDDAAQGEVIVRAKGRRLVLDRDELDKPGAAAKGPDYRRLLRAPDADKADRWSWEWRGPHGRLIARRATPR